MFLAYIDNPNNPNISIAHLEEARSHIIPLAKTMSEKIRGLRGWADTRARRASRTKNNETLPDQQATVKQTKREKAEDTFG